MYKITCSRYSTSFLVKTKKFNSNTKQCENKTFSSLHDLIIKKHSLHWCLSGSSRCIKLQNENNN